MLPKQPKRFAIRALIKMVEELNQVVHHQDLPIRPRHSQLCLLLHMIKVVFHLEFSTEKNLYPIFPMSFSWENTFLNRWGISTLFCLDPKINENLHSISSYLLYICLLSHQKSSPNTIFPELTDLICPQYLPCPPPFI